jgi:hypothetical protein
MNALFADLMQSRGLQANSYHKSARKEIMIITTSQARCPQGYVMAKAWTKFY